MADKNPNMDDLDKMLNEEPDLGDGGDPLSGDGPVDMVAQQPSDVLKESVNVENVTNELKNSFLNFLPNNTGDAIKDALWAGGDVIDEGEKLLTGIRSTGADLLSGLGEMLPESIGGTLSRLGEWIRPESFGSTGNTELTDDEKAKQEVSSLFGEAIDKQARMQELASKEQELASKTQEELLAKLVTTSKENVGLKLSYDVKYQRRNLELNLKRTIVLTRLYGLMEKYTGLASKQFEAIVKNTSLPDFAKQSSVEMIKHTLMRKTVDGSANLFMKSDLAKSIKDNAKQMIQNKMGSVASGLGAGKEMVDSIQSMQDMVTPAAMLTDLLASTARKKVSDSIMEPFIKGLFKSDKTKDVYKDIEELRNDPSKVISKLNDNIDSNAWHAGISKNVLSVLEELTKTSDKSNISTLIDTSTLNKPSFFDEKTKFSITNVIPALLGKILQEVKTIRKGKKEISEGDLEYFDYARNKFVNKKAVKKEITKTMKEATKNVSNTFETRILPLLTGNAKLSKKEILYLYDKFNEYLLNGGSLSPFEIADSFPKLIRENTRLYKLANIELRKFTNADAVKEGKHVKLREEVENYKYNSFNNFNSVLKKAQDIGDYEILAELGLMSKDDLTTINNSNIEKYNVKFGKVNLASSLLKKEELERKHNGPTKNIPVKNTPTENIVQNQNTVSTNTNQITNQSAKLTKVNKTKNDILTTTNNILNNKKFEPTSINNTNFTHTLTKPKTNVSSTIQTYVKKYDNRKVVNGDNNTNNNYAVDDIKTKNDLLVTNLSGPAKKLENYSTYNIKNEVKPHRSNNVFNKVIAKSQTPVKPTTTKNNIVVPELNIEKLLNKLDFKDLEKMFKELSKNFNVTTTKIESMKFEDIDLKQNTRKWYEKVLNKNINKVLTNLRNLPNVIVKGLQNILTTNDKNIKKYFDRLIEVIKSAPKVTSGKIDISGLTNAIRNMSNSLNSKIDSLTKSLRSTVSKTTGAKEPADIKTQIASTVLTKASSGIQTIANKITGNTEPIKFSLSRPDKIKDIVTNKINDIKGLDKDKIVDEANSITDTIVKSFNSVKQKVISKLQSLDIALPKFVLDLKDNLTNIFTNISKGIKDNIPEINPEIKKTFESLKSTFTDVVKTVNKDVGDFYKDFKESLSNENQARLKYLEDKIKDTNNYIVKTYDKAKNYLDNPNLIKDDFDKATTKIQKEYIKAKDKVTSYIKDPKVLKKEAKELKDNLKKDLKEKSKGTKAEASVEKAIKVFEKIEKNMPTSKKELQEALEVAKDKMPKNNKELKEAIQNAEKTLKSKAFETTKNIQKGIENLDNEKLTSVATSMVDKLNSLGNKVGIDSIVSGSTKSKLSNGVSGTIAKVESVTKGLVNKAQDALTDVNDLDSDFLKNSKTIEDMIENHGFLKVLKKEMLNINLPKTVQEAETMYKSLFTVLDPTGETWDNLYTRDPKLLDKLRDLHLEAIEEARKGLLEKGLDLTSGSVEGGVNLIGKARDKLLNLLPKPIRDKVEPLLKNRFTSLTGDITKRVSRAGNAAGKLLLAETKNIAKEGLNLVYDPATGTVHLPRLTDVARFGVHALTGHTKAMSKALKVFYPEIFGGAGKIAKTALKTAWDLTGIGRSMSRAKALAKAKFNPPVDRRLYNAWLEGKLTAGQIMDMLESDTDKKQWENFLTIIKPTGLTLPGILLKTGKGFLEMTKIGTKGAKATLPIVGKLLFTGSKLLTKQAWNLTGVGDLVKAKAALLKAKVKPPINDKMLYNAWLNGEITSQQVEAALGSEEEKQSWNNFLLKVSPKGLKLSETLNKTGKSLMDMLDEDSEKTVIGNPLVKAIKSIITAPVKLVKGIGKFGLKTARGIDKFGKGTAKFISDIMDKKLFSKPPIYYLPDELIETAGDFIAKVLPDEIEGVPKHEVMNMFFEKIQSRKVNRLVKNLMEKLIYILPKINRDTYFEKARSIVLEVAGLIVEYNSKRKEEKRLKQEKKKNELAEIYKEAGLKAPTDENMEQEKKDAEELKNSVVKELGKEPTKYIDLLSRWDLKEQLEFIVVRATDKGYDGKLFKHLEKDVDYDNKDLINSLRRFSELFANYKKNKLTSLEPIKEEADNIIINLVNFKSFSIPSANDVLSSVIGKLTGTETSSTNNEEIINNIVENNTSESEPSEKIKTNDKTISETRPKNNKSVKEERAKPVTEKPEEKITKSSNPEKNKKNNILNKVTKFFVPEKPEQESIQEKITKSKKEKSEKDIIEKEIDDLKEIKNDIKETAKSISSIKNLAVKKEKESDEHKVASYLDVNHNGTRDGNWRTRLSKLYGKAKDKLTSSKKTKKDSNSIWSKLLKYAPIVAGAIALVFKKPLATLGKITKWVGEKLFKGLWSITKWLGKDFGKGLWSITKWLGKSIKSSLSGIGDVILKALSHLPGMKWLSKFASHAAAKATKIGATIVEKSSKIATKAAEVTGNILSKGKTLIKKVVPEGVKAIAKKVPVGLVEKILSKLKFMKKIVLEKFGEEAAEKLLGKIASRFVPFLGEALLAADAVEVGYYMLHDHLPLDSAISKDILGFDIFGNEKKDKKEKTIGVPTDENGNPIKPTLSSEAKKEAEEKAKKWVKEKDGSKTPIAKKDKDNTKKPKIIDKTGKPIDDIAKPLGPKFIKINPIIEDESKKEPLDKTKIKKFTDKVTKETPVNNKTKSLTTKPKLTKIDNKKPTKLKSKLTKVDAVKIKPNLVKSKEIKQEITKTTLHKPIIKKPVETIKVSKPKQNIKKSDIIKPITIKSKLTKPINNKILPKKIEPKAPKVDKDKSVVKKPVVVKPKVQKEKTLTASHKALAAAIVAAPIVSSAIPVKHTDTKEKITHIKPITKKPKAVKKVLTKIPIEEVKPKETNISKATPVKPDVSKAKLELPKEKPVVIKEVATKIPKIFKIGHLSQDEFLSVVSQMFDDHKHFYYLNSDTKIIWQLPLPNPKAKLDGEYPADIKLYYEAICVFMAHGNKHMKQLIHGIFDKPRYPLGSGIGTLLGIEKAEFMQKVFNKIQPELMKLAIKYRDKIEKVVNLLNNKKEVKHTHTLKIKSAKNTKTAIKTKHDNKALGKDNKSLHDETKTKTIKAKKINLPDAVDLNKLSSKDLIKLYGMIYDDGHNTYFKGDNGIMWKLPLPKPNAKLKKKHPLDVTLYFEALLYATTTKDNKELKEYARKILEKPKATTGNYQKYMHVSDLEKIQMELLRKYLYLKTHNLLNKNAKDNKNEKHSNIKEYKQDTSKLNTKKQDTEKTSDTNNRNITNTDNHKPINTQAHILQPKVHVNINNPGAHDIKNINKTTKESVTVQKSMDNKLSELINLNKKLVSHLTSQANNGNNNGNNDNDYNKQPLHSHRPSSSRGSENVPKSPVDLKTKVF